MLKPFHEVTPEVVSAIAQICHEANRDYCASMGDHSQVAWEEAPDWQRQSAVNGVMYAIANDFPSPQAMHHNWYSEKAAAGWKLGEFKDPTRKLHPCMVPYSELPESQRLKDLIFRSIVVGIHAALYRPAKPPGPSPEEQAILDRAMGEPLHPIVSG